MSTEGTMDAAALTAALKQMEEAIAAGSSDKAVQLIKRMKAEVSPTEELLRTTKAGSVFARHRKNPDAAVAELATDIVKVWKEIIEGQRKRKREADEAAGKVVPPKKVKSEPTAAGSGTASPAAPTPTERDIKPLAKVKKEVPEVKKEVKPEVKKEVKPEVKEAKPKLEVVDLASGSGSGSRVGSPKPTAEETKFETIDTDRKTPRTAKMDGMGGIRADTEGRSGGGADPVRDKCVVMIYDALAGDSTATSDILAERAVSLERAVFEQFEYTTNNDYRSKIRSLFLNLKDKGNPGLRDKIVMGTLPAEQVVTMSKDEMASASVKAMNEKIAKNNLFKAKAVAEVHAETNAFKCGKCQLRKTSFYQMQTRSADEPMTTFVTCLNCGHKWKFC